MKVLYTVKEHSYSGNQIRIVKYEEDEREKWNYGVESRPMTIDPTEQEKELWATMGGSVGYNESVFMTYAEALAFVTKGEREQQKNPEIWLEMLEC